jgi:hypothetical protein
METTSEVRGTGSGKPKYLNVIMHGAFGYVFDDDCICAYTPACFDHEYNAGDIKMSSNTPLCHGVDYTLVGVKSSCSPTITPQSEFHPVLSLADIKVARGDIDNWDNGKQWTKRFSMFRLPYPAQRDESVRKLMYGAVYSYVGAIYSGMEAADCLNNKMKMCPSLHVFVYELDESQSCWLLPNNQDCPPISCPPQNSTDPDTVNFHLFCTKPPMKMGQMKSMGMTPEGHIRRTFAALVDMFGGLELVLNFPNQFHPAIPERACAPPPPVGAGPEDLDPGKTSDPCKGGFSPFFGHVNCEYTDLIFVP